ncbi:MAG: PIN domain-containing protein [Spirochaetaceae bacterium]|jgi:predicted nucleic acid-binding protein|nr:PIN domain-containing protein [Spirochaetaceae bacterium]
MNGKEKAFLDTNVVIYLYSEDETQKQQIAEEIVDDYDCCISTQVLNEYCSACITKFHTPLDDVRASVEEMLSEFPNVNIEPAQIRNALDLRVKYDYNYWDCLMLSAALKAGCNYIFTEDMQDGQIIENRLTIKNIFNTSGAI